MLISLKRLELAQICIPRLLHILIYLPLNGVIAKIVLCVLDLLFEAKMFETLISIKRLENALDYLCTILIFAVVGQHYKNCTVRT